MWLCNWSGEREIREQVKKLWQVSAELSVILCLLCRLEKDADSKWAEQRGRQREIQRDVRSWRIHDVCVMLSDTRVDFLCQTWTESFQRSPWWRHLRGSPWGHSSLKKEKETTFLPERKWLQSATWSQSSLYSIAMLLQIHTFIFHHLSLLCRPYLII